MRIAITGSPGVGKSTALRNALKQLTCTYGGMASADIRVKGERVGFEIRDIATGTQGILAHRQERGPRLGKYHVNLEDLNNIGVSAIKNALGSELIVIDEIGPMELKSLEFIKSVEEALHSGKSLLVVLHQKSSHPIAEQIRKEFEVYTVTHENRESMVAEIAGKFKALL